MTPRRLSLDPPLASTGWAARRAPRPHYDHPRINSVVPCHRGAECNWPACEAKCDGRPGNFSADAIDAKIEAIWAGNMARRGAAAAAYGEPETPHEFYAGRPGSQAETIVCGCLRALQKIPEIDRLFADLLMDRIAKVYLATAPDGKTEIRRASALLRIAGERA
jgi:hypothetical protein